MLTYAVVADGNMRIAHEKGEIKNRYWNPGNIFAAVHVIVLADDDIEPEKVKQVAGKAQFFIHPVGRVTPFNWLELRRRIQTKIAEIRPDVVRGHGPFLQGYFAVYAAQQLGIPSFASIHDDISIYRRFWTYGKGYVKITAYQLAMKLTRWEQYVYVHANRLVPKYEAAGRLLKQSRHRHKVEIIYNAIYLDTFRDLKPRLLPGETLKIINVGRQFSGKDQRPLIEALQGIEATLTLVGVGPLRAEYERTAHRCGVVDKVCFIDAIPNHKLSEEYAQHHVFAINMVQPGISMTVMEAMALGFPVVINQPRWEKRPEISGECALVVESRAEGFHRAFRDFLDQTDKVEKMGRLSRQVIEQYSGEEMEQREVDLIMGLVKKKIML